jgi:hypothetical protein
MLGSTDGERTEIAAEKHENSGGFQARLRALRGCTPIYKIVWLIIVAYPLWSVNQLAGSPAEEMTNAFLWVVLPIVAMPWKYAVDQYVLYQKI